AAEAEGVRAVGEAMAAARVVLREEHGEAVRDLAQLPQALRERDVRAERSVVYRDHGRLAASLSERPAQEQGGFAGPTHAGGHSETTANSNDRWRRRTCPGETGPASSALQAAVVQEREAGPVPTFRSSSSRYRRNGSARSGRRSAKYTSAFRN